MKARGQLRAFLSMDEHNELYSRLGSIEAKVDILLERENTTQRRLGKLEKFETKALTLTAVASAIFAYIAKIAL
jgi:hypothetical protein